jgi:hypothetical protein
MGEFTFFKIVFLSGGEIKMKATINGVVLEGTPEEIIQYQKLLAEKNAKNQYEKYKFDMRKIIQNIEDVGSAESTVLRYQD